MPSGLGNFKHPYRPLAGVPRHSNVRAGRPLPAGLTWRYQNVILGPGGRGRPGTGQRWRARAERPRRATKDSNASALESCGGARGIRTPDLFHAMEARYQLRHSPVFSSPPLGDSTTLADRRRGAQIKNNAARHTLFLAVGRSPVYRFLRRSGRERPLARGLASPIQRAVVWAMSTSGAINRLWLRSCRCHGG